MISSRVDTGTAVGAGMTGGGLTAEVAKKVADSAKDNVPNISHDIMQFDVLFFIPDYHLNTGGAIAIIGVILLAHSSYRGWKEKKKREKRDRIK